MPVTINSAYQKVLGPIVLGVADIRTSHVFYSSLGYETKSCPTDSICFFRTSLNQILMIFDAHKLSSDLSLKVSIPAHLQESGYLYHYIYNISDLDSLFQAVTVNKGQTCYCTDEVGLHALLGIFVDPDGYVWNVRFLEKDYQSWGMPSTFVARYWEPNEAIAHNT